jgi:hypothetical protein
MWRTCLLAHVNLHVEDKLPSVSIIENDWAQRNRDSTWLGGQSHEVNCLFCFLIFSSLLSCIKAAEHGREVELTRAA